MTGQRAPTKQVRVAQGFRMVTSDPAHGDASMIRLFFRPRLQGWPSEYQAGPGRPPSQDPCGGKRPSRVWSPLSRARRPSRSVSKVRRSANQPDASGHAQLRDAEGADQSLRSASPLSIRNRAAECSGSRHTPTVAAIEHAIARLTVASRRRWGVGAHHLQLKIVSRAHSAAAFGLACSARIASSEGVLSTTGLRPTSLSARRKAF